MSFMTGTMMLMSGGSRFALILLIILVIGGGLTFLIVKERIRQQKAKEKAAERRKRREEALARARSGNIEAFREMPSEAEAARINTRETKEETYEKFQETARLNTMRNDLDTLRDVRTMSDKAPSRKELAQKERDWAASGHFSTEELGTSSVQSTLSIKPSDKTAGQPALEDAAADVPAQRAPERVKNVPLDGIAPNAAKPEKKPPVICPCREM